MALSQRNDKAVQVRSKNVRFLIFEKDDDAEHFGVASMEEQVGLVHARLHRLLRSRQNVNLSVREWTQTVRPDMYWAGSLSTESTTFS